MKLITLFLFQFLVIATTFAQDKGDLQFSLLDSAYQHLEKKDYQNAAIYFEKSFAINYFVDHAEDYLKLAIAYSYLGKKAQAMDYIEQTLRKDDFKQQDKLFANEAFDVLNTEKQWVKLKNDYYSSKKVKTLFKTINNKDEDLHNLIPFQKNGLWGYMQRNTKQILIPPTFKTADFYRKRKQTLNYYTLKVELNDNDYYVSSDGDLMEYNYSIYDSEIEEVPRKSDNSDYIPVKNLPNLNKKGFKVIDDKTNFYYKKYTSFYLIHNEAALVVLNNEVGIVKKDGSAFLPCFNFQDEELINWFNNFYHFIRQNKKTKKWSMLSVDKGELINDLDREPIPRNGGIYIKKNGKYGFMDYAGNVLVTPQFENFGPDFSNKDIKYKYYIFSYENATNSFFVDENGIEYR